jgi:hypothetical protein
MHLSQRFSSLVLVTLTCTASLAAQQPDCPGLPTPPAPKIEECKTGWREALKGLVGAGCAAENDRRKAGYERMTRGFASGLEYNSNAGFFANGLDAEPRIATIDSLRGCSGENVNLEFTPGNVTYFEYELIAPNQVAVSKHAYNTWTGNSILGESLTLGETGYYTLITRTIAPVAYHVSKNKDGTTERTAYYPRSFHVGFRSDASVKALAAGDKVDATINFKQPFFRKVVVKSGTKVRFRFASQGSGDFLVIVRSESGEEKYRNVEPTSFYETVAFSPKVDEQFKVEVRPWTASQSVGLQFSVVDDKATGEPITATSHVTGAFKLPAHFDAAASPSVATSETVRFIYQAAGVENLSVAVKPSQLAGLSVKVRAYNQDSEEVTLRSPVVNSTNTFALPITSAGTWIVEMTPVAAIDLAEAGEAKYALEFSRATAAPVAGPKKAKKGSS